MKFKNKPGEGRGKEKYFVTKNESEFKESYDESSRNTICFDSLPFTINGETLEPDDYSIK